ncbi:hypothetical protein [Streptomyces pacificus]
MGRRVARHAPQQIAGLSRRSHRHPHHLHGCTRGQQPQQRSSLIHRHSRSGSGSSRVRHLVEDRLDITGARWGLSGAEVVLKPRALRANGDFHAYWAWHQQQEFIRNHQTRYRDQVIPTA